MEQMVARWAHNPKVTGSSPVPATTKGSSQVELLFFCLFNRDMKKPIFFLLFLFSLSRPVFSQVYVRSSGIRLDETSIGLTMVQRIFKSVTVEGIIDFRQKEFGVALVPRVHTKILGRRLNAFIGFGAQTGMVKVNESKIQPYWGLGGMIGLEYKFNLIPIHISYDIRPLVQLDGHPDLFGIQSSFAIRIVRKSERKAWKEKLKKWREDARDWFDGD
jgi:hypothetical protein